MHTNNIVLSSCWHSCSKPTATRLDPLSCLHRINTITKEASDILWRDACRRLWDYEEYTCWRVWVAIRTEHIKVSVEPSQTITHPTHSNAEKCYMLNTSHTHYIYLVSVEQTCCMLHVPSNQTKPNKCRRGFISIHGHPILLKSLQLSLHPYTIPSSYQYYHIIYHNTWDLI